MTDAMIIRKLRDLPIEGVAERLGLHVQRHKALCPFHDDHHASLAFDRRRNTCRCFVCMQRGIDTIDLVRQALGIGFREACQWLASEACIDIAPQPQPRPQAEEQPFDAQRYERFFHRPWLSAEARRFLFQERRIDPRVAGWCRIASWQDRRGTHWLQTPYYDAQGKLIGLQNRNLQHGQPGHEDEPRFRFPKGARCQLYNLPVTTLIQPDEPLYIAEGCTDCWALLSAGHKAIAVPSATTLSDESRRLLQRLAEERRPQFHMVPDNDAPGERLFLQLQQLLPGIVRHQLPQGCKDYAMYHAQLNTSCL